MDSGSASGFGSSRSDLIRYVFAGCGTRLLVRPDLARLDRVRPDRGIGLHATEGLVDLFDVEPEVLGDPPGVEASHGLVAERSQDLESACERVDFLLAVGAHRAPSSGSTQIAATQIAAAVASRSLPAR